MKWLAATPWLLWPMPTTAYAPAVLYGTVKLIAAAPEKVPSPLAVTECPSARRPGYQKALICSPAPKP